ncbi:MAG: hypothetical protein ACOYXA_14470 [Bacteroidota bacterium]
MKSILLLGILSMVASPRDPFWHVRYRLHNATLHMLTVKVFWQTAVGLEPQTFALPPRAMRVIYEEGQLIPEHPYGLISSLVFTPVCEKGYAPYEVDNMQEVDWQEDMNDMDAYYTLVLSDLQSEPQWGPHVAILAIPDHDFQ